MKQADSLKTKTSSGEVVTHHGECCFVLFDSDSKTGLFSAGFAVWVLS